MAEAVLSLVADPSQFVRVEADYDADPLEVRVVSSPERPGQLYDSSLGTVLVLSADLAAHLHQLAAAFGHRYGAVPKPSDTPRKRVTSLTLSVHHDGDFHFGTTLRDWQPRG